MTARNQLRELLREDQEPFHLRDFIADRRPKKTSSTSIIDPKQSSSFTKNICRKACFFSGADSPNVAVLSPTISTKNLILLHVPARTAEMLLEASERIKKPRKSYAERLRKIGSFLKKLRYGGDGEERGKSEFRLLVKWESPTSYIGRSVTLRQNVKFSPEIPAINSADQDLDFEAQFRSSPFRSVLHDPSTGHETPEFSSTLDSPSRVDAEEFEKSSQKDSVDQCVNDTKEKEKHCSPVSVLDPDPCEGEDNIVEDDDESDGFDIDRSCAKVQRVQEKLLEKLSRFERLAELDPLELEIRFEESEEEDDHIDGFDFADEEGGEVCKETESLSNKRALSYIDHLTKDILMIPKFKMLKRVPAELKKVIKVLLTEGERKLDGDDKSILLERVVRKLSSCEEVGYVIAGLEIAQNEVLAWSWKHEQVSDAVMEIELGILGALMEELWEEACYNQLVFN